MKVEYLISKKENKYFFIFFTCMIFSTFLFSQEKLQKIFIDKEYTVLDSTYLDKTSIDTNAIRKLGTGNWCIFHDYNNKILAAKFQTFQGQLNGDYELYDIQGYQFIVSSYCRNKLDRYNFIYINKRIQSITLYNHGEYDGVYYKINEKGKVYQSSKKERYLFKRKLNIVKNILLKNNLYYNAQKRYIGKIKMK